MEGDGICHGLLQRLLQGPLFALSSGMIKQVWCPIILVIKIFSLYGTAMQYSNHSWFREAEVVTNRIWPRHGNRNYFKCKWWVGVLFKAVCRAHEHRQVMLKNVILQSNHIRNLILQRQSILTHKWRYFGNKALKTNINHNCTDHFATLVLDHSILLF